MATTKETTKKSTTKKASTTKKSTAKTKVEETKTKVLEPNLDKLNMVKEEEMTMTKKRLTARELRRAIPKDLEVSIMNTTNGDFYYECQRTGTIIELNGFGDISEVDIEVLSIMKSRSKTILANNMLLIVDVISDEFDLEDVLTYLSINNNYANLGIEDGDCIDDIILNTTSKEFEDILEGMSKSFSVHIARRCIQLFREGNHDIQYRADRLCEKLGVEDIFIMEK